MWPRQLEWEEMGVGEAASFEGQFLRYGEPGCPGVAS